MTDNKYNFWCEICDIFVQNMVHFSSQLDKRISTKYMQFIALGNILVYTFTLHTSDNNKEEYCTKQFRCAHLTISAKNELKLIWPSKYIICRNHILSYTETRLIYWLLGNILRQLELCQFFYGKKFDTIGEVLDVHILDFSTVSYQKYQFDIIPIQII
jgi:hypothetical protein